MPHLNEVPIAWRVFLLCFCLLVVQFSGAEKGLIGTWCCCTQVSIPASADVEERAWTVLTDYQRSSDQTCIPGAQSHRLSFSNVAKASIGGNPKPSSVGCFGERGNINPFQQEHGRHIDNVSLAPETENCTTLMTYLLHGVHQACDGSKHDRRLEEQTEWLRDDPVLSALLRRFDEVEAEVEKRHSAELKWRKPNSDLGK